MIKKKGQISIFIIVMLLIIMLFVFLFSFQSDSKTNKIDAGEGLAGGETYNFENLQVELNFCLTNSLEKAILLASLRGGLLYDGEGLEERYLPGNYFGDYYDKVLNPYSIENDEILYYTKVRTSGIINIPLNDVTIDNTLIFPGYKSQFQDYMLNEVFSCVNFVEYQDAGYSIEKKLVSSRIKSLITSKSVELENIEGSDGDVLFMEYEDTLLEGVLIINNGKYIGDFSTSIIDFTTLLDIQNYLVINKDLSIYIDISFEKESIRSTLYFPVVLKEKQVSVSSLELSSISNVRFKKLLSSGKKLIEQKILNRTLDYSDSNHINIALSSSISDVGISKTILDNQPNHKLFIYTIHDTNSEFLGVPLQFNIVYENFAPYLNFSLIPTLCLNYTSDTCKIAMQPGQRLEDNFDSILIPYEQIDVDNSAFETLEVRDENVWFDINPLGKFSFNASVNGTFLYTIVLSDGEASNEYLLVFNVSG